jgi:cation diffusion facilitator CzcD-associated flavoprotein CzcO
MQRCIVVSVPRLEDFGGESFHTGRWPHEGVDFTGRRVAQIGTGSTGTQAAPVIAREADHLYVFQRTPNYTVPARDRPMGRGEWVRIKARYDDVVRATKESFAGFPYTPSSRSALELDDEERTAIYEALWEEGGFKFLWGGFFDLLLDERANETAAEFIRSKIRTVVHDPEVAEPAVRSPTWGCRSPDPQPVQPRHSWYLGANIPGKKRVFMPDVGGLANYRARCEDVATGDYEGFLVSP